MGGAARGRSAEFPSERSEGRKGIVFAVVEHGIDIIVGTRVDVCRLQVRTRQRERGLESREGDSSAERGHG